MSVLSESTAMRLYYSVTANASSSAATVASATTTTADANTDAAANADATANNGENDVTASESTRTVDGAVQSNESVTTMETQTCRICRWNRSDMQIMHCPCRCKGSVGFVHLQCLRRWILQRRGDPHCEICHSHFNLPEEKVNLHRMFKTFMCARCCGSIIKQLLYSASVIPLAHIILQQVLICMEKINLSPNEQLTVGEVLMASCALLTSSAIFFHFFEFITMRFLVVRNILQQWWMFGNSSDFEIIEIASESHEFM